MKKNIEVHTLIYKEREEFIMKKIKIAALAAVLSLFVGVQAMAQGSASGSFPVVLPNEEGVVAVFEATTEKISKEEALALLGEEATECDVVMMDISLEKDGQKVQLEDGQSIDVRIGVASIKADSKVIVRHMKADGTWETRPIVEQGEGYVIAKFSDFSPVAVIVEQAKTAEEKPETKPEAKPETKPEAKPEEKPETKPEAKPEENPSTSPAPSTPAEKVSPKTAETNIIYVVEIMVMAAFVGMIVFGKKARA